MEQYNLLRRHYEKLQRINFVGSCKLIFIPENNLGLEASHLDTMVHDSARVQTHWEKDKPGVCKTLAMTRNYQFVLNNVLFGSGIRFHDELFTSSRNQTPAGIKSLLQDQMLRYHWEKKPAHDHFQSDRHTMTGKQGDKQDDLLIAVMMTIYFGRDIINNPRRLASLWSFINLFKCISFWNIIGITSCHH